jgi:hypothetical protein
LVCACAAHVCALMSSAKLNADKTFFMMHSKSWLKVEAVAPAPGKWLRAASRESSLDED